MGRGVSPCPVAAVIRTDRTALLLNEERAWLSGMSESRKHPAGKGHSLLMRVSHILSSN
ncbi:hypothetical protein KUCAC02_004147, partial [Chaenocephalus aceratus]